MFLNPLDLLRLVRIRLRRLVLELHRRSILKHAQGGHGLHLDGKTRIAHAENLTLGRRVHIGHDANLNCLGGISVGDYTIISGCVTIYSYNHAFRQPTCLPYDHDVELKPVRIGRYVWIGMNVTIAPGTTIGDGAVIGMGAVVSGHVPENAIVVSPKARIVGSRDAVQTRALVEDNRFFMAA